MGHSLQGSVAGDKRDAASRLIDILARAAETTPNREAAVCSRRRLSYAALNEEVRRCASALAAAGVRAGDRVATLAPPNTDFLITFLASTALGAIWLGLNPKHTRRELAYVLNDAAPSIVFVQTPIADRDYCADLASINVSLGARLIGFGQESQPLQHQRYTEFAADIGEPLSVILAAHAADESSPCLLVYTSGTTGAPKGALISQAALINAASTRIAAWGHDDFRILMNLPISHIGGVGDITCTALVAGGGLVFMERFDASRAAALISEERISCLYQIPTQLQMIMHEAAESGADLSSLQAVCWSGAKAPDSLVDRLLGQFPGRLGSDYSMTESVGPVTIVPLGSDTDVLKRSVGWPPDDLEVRLAETSSEILVRGDHLMLGYWNRADATRAVIDDAGWLRTGDTGEYRADGSLALRGRTKEMFVSGGYNIYPAEIEAVLEAHPEVAIAAVVARQDELWGEVGCAFVQPIAGAAPDAEALRDFCRADLANYKIPKLIVVEPSLPLLAVGKIDRAALRERADSAVDSGEPHRS